MTAHDVEKHEQWTASAPTLADAFAFVMEHVDQFSEPSITITARHWFTTGNDDPDERDFEVTVSGTTSA